MQPSPTSAAGRAFEPVGYHFHASFVPALGREVLTMLAPRAGEHILDLGAGDGVLSAAIAEAGATVVALDASPAMVAAAAARGLVARVGDGHALDFDAVFDAVFSNAALHWMPDAAAVTRGVFRALRPGGRFVAEAGGFGNVAAMRVALHGALAEVGVTSPGVSPWYFPTAADHRRVLEAAGFEVDDCVVFARPTPLPTGHRGWFETFAGAQLAAVPPERRAAVIDLAVARLASVLTDDVGTSYADYTRLRFVARRPG